MNRKTPVLIIILLIMVGIAVYLGALKQQPPEIVPNPDQNQTASLVTYQNEKYGIELKHPQDWQVVENTGFIPSINVIKKTGTTTTTGVLHTNITGISIYPEGLGTEGLQGEISRGTVAIAGTTTPVIQYKLDNGPVWGQFIAVDAIEKNDAWKDFAFIWAGLEVRDLKVVCMDNGEQAPDSACDFGVEATGEIVRTGTVDPQDQTIVNQILASITFNK